MGILFLPNIMAEDNKTLLLMLEKQQLQIELLQKQIESIELLLKSQKVNPITYLGMHQPENDDDVYKGNGSNLTITNKELRELIKKGNDKFLIDKIIDTVINKYQKYYGSLLYAVERWLAIDTERPASENEFLLERGIPPVAEQMRLFKGKVAKTQEYIERLETTFDWRKQEEQWRKEAEEEEAKKTPEQREKEKREREKLISCHLGSQVKKSKKIKKAIVKK